ncbi:ABC transporter permease [Agrococcus sp. Marseille-Q4369]|uniref:ABC transporter permease n=1 Tax=Agrococcus sp. Marseille-Q4369 TaxID=2810513 RepID=UPI001B8C006F|nr:ABC transporter permease [Agrococcus sp. Marseille-Q4369]QUW18564.1 ABC transporter permease [Agrococcus sp. Marseille-Q4369]
MTTLPSQSRVTLNLLTNLTLREIRSEYKRTALGRLWSLVNPLAQIAVFSVVFGVILRVTAEPGTNSGVDFFPLWIGIGVISWGYISGCIRAGMNALLSNAGLLQKVALPRWVLVLSKILSLTFTFLIELLVIAVIMGAIGGWQILLTLPLIVPLVLVTTAFVLGIGLMLSVATVYFRDMEHLWSIVSQIWMYGSGVIFPVAFVAAAQERMDAAGYSIFGASVPLLAAFQLNPAERLLSMYRNILYDFAMPSLGSWLYVSVWAAVLLGLGFLIFNRFSRNIVEEL